MKSLIFIFILLFATTAHAVEINYSLDLLASSPQGTVVHDDDFGTYISGGGSGGTLTGEVDLGQTVTINECYGAAGGSYTIPVTWNGVISLYYDGQWNVVSDPSGRTHVWAYGEWTGVSKIKYVFSWSSSSSGDFARLYEVHAIAYINEGYATII